MAALRASASTSDSTTVSGTLMTRKTPTLRNDCRTAGSVRTVDVVVEADERPRHLDAGRGEEVVVEATSTPRARAGRRRRREEDGVGRGEQRCPSGWRPSTAASRLRPRLAAQTPARCCCRHGSGIAGQDCAGELVDLVGGLGEAVVDRRPCRRSPTRCTASRNVCQISTEFGTLGTSTVRAAWSREHLVVGVRWRSSPGRRPSGRCAAASGRSCPAACRPAPRWWRTSARPRRCPGSCRRSTSRRSWRR